MSNELLLVEDDDLLRDVLEEFLSECGFVVHPAGSGTEALELIISDGLRPQVVVTDLRLPGVNGWELLEVLDQDRRLAAVPRIVITAVPDPGIASGDRTTVLRKPFASCDLVGELRRLCPGEPAEAAACAGR